MQLFITGSTGYIGGEILYQFLEKFPQIVIHALYREIGEDLIIKKQIRGENIKCIFGSLDDIKIIKKECEDADIIINAANFNHLKSIQIIKDVLINKRRKTLFLQISGTGKLVNNKLNNNKIFNDVKDIEEINLILNNNEYCETDKIVLSIQKMNLKFIKTAIICPPLIFGIGNGCKNKLSIQIPMMIKWFIELGNGFIINDGNYEWDHSHIFDVGSLFIKIIEKYLKNENFFNGFKGYYFVQDGNYFNWFELSNYITNLLYSKKLIKNLKIDKLNPTEFKNKYGVSSIYWGSNCRTKGEAGRLIGWVPVKSGDAQFWSDIEDCLTYMQL